MWIFHSFRINANGICCHLNMGTLWENYAVMQRNRLSDNSIEANYQQISKYKTFTLTYYLVHASISGIGGTYAV